MLMTIFSRISSTIDLSFSTCKWCLKAVHDENYIKLLLLSGLFIECAFRRVSEFIKRYCHQEGEKLSLNNRWISDEYVSKFVLCTSASRSPYRLAYKTSSRQKHKIRQDILIIKNNDVRQRKLDWHKQRVTHPYGTAAEH